MEAGSEAVLTCDDRHYVRPSMKEPPIKTVKLKCICDVTEPKWIVGKMTIQ